MNNTIVKGSTKINDILFLDSAEVLKDEVVHTMFRDKAYMGYIRKIVSKVLGIDEEDIDTLELAKDYLNENFDIKGSVSDVVYENKDIFLNLKFNSSKNTNYDLKNMKYVFHMVLNQIKSGELEKVDKLKKVYQINFNSFDRYGYNKLLYSSHIMEDNYHIRRNDYLQIYDIDLSLAKKLWYNKEERDSLEYYLFAISSKDDFTKHKMYEGDNLMADVVNKMDELKKEFNKDLFYDNEALLKKASYDMGKEEGIEWGKEEGIKEGIEQGAQDKLMEIAKKMLNKNYTLDEIASITLLPINEIKSLMN